MEKTIIGKTGVGRKILMILFTMCMLFMCLFFIYTIARRIEYDETTIYEKNLLNLGNKTISISSINSLSYQKEKHRSTSSGRSRTYYTWDLCIRYMNTDGTQRSLTFSPTEKYYAARDDFFELLQNANENIEWTVAKDTMPRSGDTMILKSKDEKNLLLDGKSKWSNFLALALFVLSTAFFAWTALMMFSVVEYDSQAVYKRNILGLKNKTVPLSKIRTVLKRNEKQTINKKVYYHWVCYLYYTTDDGKQKKLNFNLDEKFDSAQKKFFDFLKQANESIEWKTEDISE